jgi:hypothetical protein
MQVISVGFLVARFLGMKNELLEMLEGAVIGNLNFSWK